jgi:hypothetical protein
MHAPRLKIVAGGKLTIEGHWPKVQQRIDGSDDFRGIWVSTSGCDLVVTVPSTNTKRTIDVVVDHPTFADVGGVLAQFRTSRRETIRFEFEPTRQCWNNRRILETLRSEFAKPTTLFRAQ